MMFWDWRYQCFNIVNCVGHSLQLSELNNSLVDKYITSLLFLEDRIYWDLHVKNGPNCVQSRNEMIIQFEKIVNSYNSKMRVVVLEQNDGADNGNAHGLLRGIGHATFNHLIVD